MALFLVYWRSWNSWIQIKLLDPDQTPGFGSNSWIRIKLLDPELESGIFWNLILNTVYRLWGDFKTAEYKGRHQSKVCAQNCGRLELFCESAYPWSTKPPQGPDGAHLHHRHREMHKLPPSSRRMQGRSANLIGASSGFKARRTLIEWYQGGIIIFFV